MAAVNIEVGGDGMLVATMDLPGRPIQYGTTDQFLEFVGIKSLDELPASDVLSNRQIDDWLQTAMNPTKPPADAEMGLPLEPGEGETPNLEPVTVEHTTTEHGSPAPEDEAKTT
jgi:segregation and condensation protein B